MSKLIDLADRRFGRLLVTGRAANNAAGSARWACRCDCGAAITARGYDLTHGAVASCGCAGAERLSRRMRSRVGRGQITRLFDPVWPHVCRSCDRPFVGTARQQYCSPGCRPSAARRY